VIRTDTRWLLGVALFLAVAACGDDLAAAGDAGAAADAATRDAALPDAASGDAAVAGCSEPPASAVIGSAGGELTLCGARLAVAPGILADPAAFAIAAVAAPSPAPPRELAGPAFRFTADGGFALAAGPVEIALPHGGRPGRIELFAVEDGDLFGVEACTVDDQVIGQLVGQLGTFVATADPYPYADSPGDLGSGTLSARIGDRTASFLFPDQGYLIDQAWGQPIALAAVTDLTDGAGGAEQLRLDVLVDVDGAALLQFVQWYADGVIWQMGTPDGPGTTGMLEVESRADGRLVGTMSATLFAGADTIAFAAEFDVTPDY